MHFSFNVYKVGHGSRPLVGRVRSGQVGSGRVGSGRTNRTGQQMQNVMLMKFWFPLSLKSVLLFCQIRVCHVPVLLFN